MHATTNYDEVFLKAYWGPDWRQHHNNGMDPVAAWGFVEAEPWLQSHPHLTGIAQHIRSTLYQGADAAEAAVLARLRKGEKDSALEVVRMFLYLRTVFLQNVVFQRPLHPQHPLFAQHPLFGSRLFEEWFTLVWAPRIRRCRQQAEEGLRRAREPPVGKTDMRELIKEVMTAEPGSPEYERATQKLTESFKKATDEAERQLRQERQAQAAQPMQQPAFEAAPQPPGPPQASFARQNCNEIALLWEELSVGIDGSGPFLDCLDPGTFNLKRGFAWAPPPGGTRPGFWKHAWGAIKPALFDIYGRCGGLRGEELRAAGTRYVQAVQKAMRGDTESLEVFGKRAKSGARSAAWHRYQQLVQ